MPFCPNCGSEVQADARLCRDCGHAMQEGAKPQAAQTALPQPAVVVVPQQAVPSIEKTYYQDNKVLVTSTRAVLGAKTYAMANITSVFLGKVKRARVWGIIIALIGLIYLIGSLGADGQCTLLAFLLLIIGGLMIFLAKPFAVRIGSASGEVDGLRHRSKKYAQKVVSAINQAIVERG